MNDPKKKDPILSREYTLQFTQYLRRLFALPIVRTTIREFHSNLSRFANGDEALLKTLLEAFMQGGLPLEMQSKEHLRTMVEEFSPLVRLAKEVHDRGDFLNFVTTDQITYQDKVVFNHYIRLVDGQETRFVSDIPTIAQMIHHLVERLAGVANIESAEKSLEELKPMLKDAQEKLGVTLQTANR